VGLTATAGIYILQHVGSTFQASGQMVLLLPPDASGVETPTNPYLNLPSDLDTVAAVLASKVSTEDAEQELAAEGADAEYDVAVNPGVGPLLVITAKDKDPAAALATRDAVMRRVEAELADMQDEIDVPVRQVISTRSSSVTVRAEVLPGSRLRALAGTTSAGLLLTLVLAFGLDRLLQRREPGAGGVGARRARRSRRAGKTSAGDAEPGLAEEGTAVQRRRDLLPTHGLWPRRPAQDEPHRDEAHQGVPDVLVG
jgi:hypothetical protein